MGVIERRKREREIRRELAIDAAMYVFNEEGYHAITMEKIAERSELSRAALYLYFKNKDEILISAIVSYTDFFADLLQDLLENIEGRKAQLMDHLWDCFKQYYERDPVAFTASQYYHQSEMIRNLPAELQDVLYESGSKVVRLQHKIIEYAVNDGTFVNCNARTLSEVIWSAFLGIVYLEKSKQVLSGKSHLDVTRSLAVKILSRGVMNDPEKKVKG